MKIQMWRQKRLCDWVHLQLHCYPTFLEGAYPYATLQRDNRTYTLSKNRQQTMCNSLPGCQESNSQTAWHHPIDTWSFYRYWDTTKVLSSRNYGQDMCCWCTTFEGSMQANPVPVGAPIGQMRWLSTTFFTVQHTNEWGGNWDLGQGGCNLGTLLSHPATIPHTLQFINDTMRLRHIFGQVSTTKEQADLLCGLMQPTNNAAHRNMETQSMGGE